MKAAFSLTTLWCLLFVQSAVASEPLEPSIELNATPGGVAYGTWAKSTVRPAPVLFVLAGTVEQTLGGEYFRQCGNQLAELGYVCVSIDLPCHGSQMCEGSGLSCWSQRAARGDNFVEECNARLSAVLDHLIETGVADRNKVAVCGTSRGGYLAIHFAAHDHRILCAAAFAPVTNLAALSEFAKVVEAPLVKLLSLEAHANRLVGRPVWIIMGDQDERVGTEHAVALGERMAAAASEKQVDNRMEVHVIPGTPGHTSPQGASQLAADWIVGQMAQ